MEAVKSEQARSAKLQSDLEAAILAGLRTTSIPRYRFIYWPVIAAALVLGLLLLWQMALNIPSKQDRFIAFHSAALADFKPLPRLDLLGTTLQETQQFIQTKAAPTAPTLPLALAVLSTAGCKTLVWEGQPESLTCFNLPGCQLLHLFVIDKNAFKRQPIPDRKRDELGLRKRSVLMEYRHTNFL